MREIVTDIATGDGVLTSVYQGSKLLRDAVAVTMGPKGRNVLFKKLHHNPGMTHDGVTVANLVSSRDPQQQVALEILRQAALKQDSMIGDGTTTVTVLAHAILEHAIKAVDDGHNPMMLRRQLEEKGDEVVKILEENIDKEVTLEKLIDIATVAAGDSAIGLEVGTVVHEAGSNTPVLLNFSDSDKTYTEVISGIKIDGAPASPYLLEGSTDELVSPKIFVVDARLRERDDILPLLRCMAEFPQEDRNFLIVCTDIAGDALAYAITNKRRGFANIAVSRVPEAVSGKTIYLRDIAAACGATLIAPNTANNLREVAQAYAGSADKVIVNQLETVIVNGGAPQEDFEGYIAALKSSQKKAKTKEEREFIQNRLLMLEQKAISIFVGGRSESDAEERHYRYEDAVGASRTALRGGVVPGGGTLYLHAAANLPGDDQATLILSNALVAPLHTVLSNAGIDYKMDEMGLGKGYDVLHPESGVVNLVEVGILDPAESEIESFKTAVAVAGLLLTSGAIIVDKIVGEEDAEDSKVN